MQRVALTVVLVGLPAIAWAGSNTSTYTSVDLKACKQIEKPDGFVFEGSWRCKGLGGYSVFISAANSREMAAFGKKLANNCAGLKTFSGFNSTGGTVEWRLKNSKPIAAILRWTVSIDPEDSTKTATWLVVNKLEKNDSCHMHYVSGSYPNANEQARKAADAWPKDLPARHDVQRPTRSSDYQFYCTRRKPGPATIDL